MKLRAKRETEIGYYDGIPGAKPLELATLEPGDDIFINLDDFEVVQATPKEYLEVNPKLVEELQKSQLKPKEKE